jgi:cytochrome c peroxidase
MERKQYKYYVLAISILLGFCSCKPDDTNPDGPKLYNFLSPILFGTAKHLNPENPLSEEGIDLGRHLFYEPMLSLDSTRTCASCHQQKFAFSDSLSFSRGVRNQLTERHSMSISNTAWQSAFFWDGRAKTLEEQALKPIENPKEMDLKLSELIKRLNASAFYVEKFKCAFPGQGITSTTIAKAIAQFEQTLVSSNSKFDQYKLGYTSASEQEKRGEQLFFTHPDANAGLRGGNCGDCHAGTLTFSNSFSNNGLDSAFSDIGRENVTANVIDRGRFKIPSLRNIELTAPYMHDGRFSTLEEVLDHYNEHIQPSNSLDILIKEASNNPAPLNNKLGLTAQEKADIIVFLKMLTDKDFVKDARFSDPFKK